MHAPTRDDTTTYTHGVLVLGPASDRRCLTDRFGMASCSSSEELQNNNNDGSVGRTSIVQAGVTV